MNLNSLKDKIELDHPVIIVLVGHLTIFLLAIPYFYKFSAFSLLKIFLVIFLYILFFSIPFMLNLNINAVFNIGNNINNSFTNNKTIAQYDSNIYLILLFILISYGVFNVTNSPLLSVIYPLLVIGILNLFAKCMTSSIQNIPNKNNTFNNLSDNNTQNKFSIFDKFCNPKLIDNIIFFIGIISFILIVIQNNAIPLFDYNVRMNISADPLRLISTGALVYGGLNNIFYFAISFIILTLMGYKAGILILCISFLIYGYKTKRIPIKWLLMSCVGLIIFLSVMAKLILLSSGQEWKISALGILSYRAYFDILVLEKIINHPNLMLGNITLNPIGEMLIGKTLFNYSHNITSTMFGPVYLDFGIYGVLFAFLLGIASKLIYSGNSKLYAIYASILLSMCEIGINYGFLIVLLLLLYVNSLESKC
jgi:uncharacterized membrane protein